MSLASLRERLENIAKKNADDTTLDFTGLFGI